MKFKYECLKLNNLNLIFLDSFIKIINIIDNKIIKINILVISLKFKYFKIISVASFTRNKSSKIRGVPLK
ncbi:hypothetical protein [Candidatus Arthromitus sp. SFB-rat-Yit]|uniref:hypothetical protein n=1 Tax=Candidatus Arthromitus sp. SFB-rat-Yit TaxID=1041504 RepID=UPI001FA6DA8F|nr:hypothetical protein [Candidatus Arthromitus sp. SFB-rat-Yit]